MGIRSRARAPSKSKPHLPPAMTRFSSLVAIAAVATITSDALVPGADAARSLLQNRNGNRNGNRNVFSFNNGNRNGNGNGNGNRNRFDSDTNGNGNGNGNVVFSSANG